MSQLRPEAIGIFRGAPVYQYNGAWYTAAGRPASTGPTERAVRRGLLTVWTAATWPRWLPRRADGGLPRVPGWMTRGLPRRGEA